MVHVQIDGSGAVVGIFAEAQPQLAGYSAIPDSDPRIATFTALQSSVLRPRPSPRQWLERLPPATQQAIVKASLADQTGAILLLLLKAAGNDGGINVSDPETVSGLAFLVAAGVITAQDQSTLLSIA